MRLSLVNKELFDNENHDIAIAMSPSRADPVLGLNILQGWLVAFKRLILTTNERVGLSMHLLDTALETFFDTDSLSTSNTWDGWSATDIVSPAGRFDQI